MKNLAHGDQDLTGKWKLRGADGQRGAVLTHHLQETGEAKWMEASVPGEVHLTLLEHGLIEEPTVGLNALSGSWVEECLWSYRTSRRSRSSETAGSLSSPALSSHG